MRFYVWNINAESLLEKLDPEVLAYKYTIYDDGVKWRG